MITYADKQRTFFPRRRELIERTTPSEKAFAARLTNAGIRFIEQKGFLSGNFYCICDFYLPRPYKAVIEIDGGYHGTPEQVARDRRKDAYLRERGCRVIRIPNEQVSTFDLSLLKKRGAK